MAARRSSAGPSLWPFLFSISAGFNFLMFFWQGSVPSCVPSDPPAAKSCESVDDTGIKMLGECRAEVARLKEQRAAASGSLEKGSSLSTESFATRGKASGAENSAREIEKCLADGRQLAVAAQKRIEAVQSELEACRSLAGDPNDEKSDSLAGDLNDEKSAKDKCIQELELLRSQSLPAATTSTSDKGCMKELEHMKTGVQSLEKQWQDTLKTSEQQFLNLQQTKSACVDPRLELSPRWRGVEQLIRARSMSPLPQSASQVEIETFDITVNAFKRDVELEYSLNVYLKCKRETATPIGLIHVIWNDIKREVPENLKNLADTDELKFFIPPVEEDRISNRFWPLEEFSSDAVFHVDDDVPHMCETLSDMFQLWRTDTDGMVGSSPRYMDLYHGERDIWFAPLVMGEYNIVFLTKGAFVHRRFLDEYWKDVWKPFREVVDKYNCAEDILFSAMHLALIGTDHVYAIGGSVNHGRTMLLEGHEFYLQLGKVESYTGLNVRTHGVRGVAILEIVQLMNKTFPEKMKDGRFARFQRKWWRSNVAPELSCRQAPIACYNRAWDSCYQDCDVPVRGNSVCFTGDSACYAGMGLSLSRDIRENMQMVCTGDLCRM